MRGRAAALAGAAAALAGCGGPPSQQDVVEQLQLAHPPQDADVWEVGGSSLCKVTEIALGDDAVADLRASPPSTSAEIVASPGGDVALSVEDSESGGDCVGRVRSGLESL